MTDNTEEIIKRLKTLEERVKHLEALEYPSIAGALVDYSPYSTITGWSSFSIKEILYKKVGSLVFVSFRLIGVSDSDSASFTLPFTRSGTHFIYALIRARDNSGARTVGLATVGVDPNLARLSPNLESSVWTASGTKEAFGQFIYVANE